MKFIFKRGRHRARPLYWLKWFPILIGRKSISRVVTFSFSAKYDIPGTEDDADVNKLFGVSSFFLHRNSSRFGYYFDTGVSLFCICSYVYKNGERFINKLAMVPANRPILLEISWDNLYYRFTGYDQDKGQYLFSEPVTGNNKKLFFLLGPYFGGNNSAPHDMAITIKK